MNDVIETPTSESQLVFEPLPSTRRPVSTWRRLTRSTGAMIGLILIFSLMFLAFTADIIAPQGIDDQALRKGLFPPSREFPLGTDEFGRDMLSRIIHGSRVSLQVGIIATCGLVDISWAFPTVLLAIFMIAVMGPGLVNVMIAVGFSYWGGFTRVVRGQVLSLREWEFVLAAKSLGASDLRIMIQEMLPNIVAPVIVMSTLMMADAILIEATLSFLGMGAQPPIPSWGSILSSGRSYLRLAPWVTFFPGIAIMLTVFGFNLLGDGLRDALDPRLKNA